MIVASLEGRSPLQKAFLQSPCRRVCRCSTDRLVRSRRESALRTGANVTTIHQHHIRGGGATAGDAVHCMGLSLGTLDVALLDMVEVAERKEREPGVLIGTRSMDGHEW